jgi:hypothetical protein
MNKRSFVRWWRKVMLNFRNSSKWKKIKIKDNNGGAINPIYVYIFFVLAGIVFFVYYNDSGEDKMQEPNAVPSEIVSTEGIEGSDEGVGVVLSEDLPIAGSDNTNSLVIPPAETKLPLDQKGVSVLIEKKAHKLVVLKDGRTVREYGVAVGKNSGDKQRVGDMRTPEGTFPVQQIQNASSWTHDFKDGKGAIRDAYGPLFIRLATPPWSGIGIHGTHDPNSIGADVTEGCIRLNNNDLREFRQMIAVGTRVTIKP